MITSKDDQGAVSEMMIIKIVEQPPDLEVDIRGLCVILIPPTGVVASAFSLLEWLIDEFHAWLALRKSWWIVVLLA